MLVNKKRLQERYQPFGVNTKIVTLDGFFDGPGERKKSVKAGGHTGTQ